VPIGTACSKKATLCTQYTWLVISSISHGFLTRMSFTADEIKMLKAYKGEVEKLGVPERFLYTMAKIPKVEARLQGFIFKQVIAKL
jgi:hypothetical protein